MDLIIQRYEKLSESMKTAENREQLQFKDFVLTRKDLESFPFENPDIWLQFMYQSLRYLRNTCIHSSKNQMNVLNSDILNLFTRKLLENLLEPDLEVAVRDVDLLCKTKLVAVQFLGNVVVQNETTRNAVWDSCFPTLFFKLMSSVNNEGKDCLCMVVYNCIRERNHFFSTDDDFWLALLIITFVKDCTQTEWGLLILELFICSSYFSPLFKKLDTYSAERLVVLEFIYCHLTESSSEKQVELPEENLLYLAELFETKLTCILVLATGVSDELVEESLLIVKLLSILCVSTACYHKYKQVRSRESLLKACIKLLQGFVNVNLKKEESNIRNEEPTTSLNRDVVHRHPYIGLQRDIIRLIGNMCYATKTMQDLVYECNGIPLILSSCVIDDQNPYIMQWAIFAIRNICEDNRRNQEVVRSFEMKGISDNKFLRGSNIRTKVVDGKITLSSDKIL